MNRIDLIKAVEERIVDRDCYRIPGMTFVIPPTDDEPDDWKERIRNNRVCCRRLLSGIQED